MKLIELINSYQKKLESNSYDFSCLLFALQIPSICSRIEFCKTSENTGRCEDGKLYKPNGKPWDANMYKQWLKRHGELFKDIYYPSMTLDIFCEALYVLRCQMTHEGILMADDSHFYFTDDDSAMSVGDIVILPMKRLCEDMLFTALSLFDSNNVDIRNKFRSFDITPFDEMFLSRELYTNICDNVWLIYKSFWQKYSRDDRLLNSIYMRIRNVELDIDSFFIDHPDDIFMVSNFSMFYGSIADISERFIKDDVLYLSKQDYERMKHVYSELTDFMSNHPFTIKSYIGDK